MSRGVVGQLSLVLVIVGLVWLLSGCSSGSNVNTDNMINPGDAIEITSISPRINTILQVGNSYTFEVAVEYTLEEENGYITLVIQGDDSTTYPLAEVFAPIIQGSGELTLTSTITIPSTNSIQVFTPLAPQGVSKTNVVDVRVYWVTGN